MYEYDLRFVATSSNCLAEQFLIYPRKADHKIGISLWLVCLSSDLFERTKEESVFTIAHELAHVYLEHSKHSDESTSEGLAYS